MRRIPEANTTARVAVPRASYAANYSDYRHGYYGDNYGHGHYYSGYHHAYYPYYPYYPAHYHHYHASYYYYPYYRYPYGYGAFGVGFFYYDPYVWAPTWYYNGYNYGYGYGYPTGEVRLQVMPRDAEVYVDGNFAGIVDDFDGSFQGLRLEEGTYRIEIIAPGYEPLEFDVQIQPGRKINYRGTLLTVRP